jgi:DNA-binding NarL/FixJ family response regulator
MTIHVLLADVQALLRQTFRILLDSCEDIEVVGEAADGREAVDQTRRLRPDIVVIDIRMPGTDGLAATTEICADEELSDIRVLILTTFEIDEYVARARRAGASGFLGKDADADDLVAAVRTVAAGESLFSPQATRSLISRFIAAPEPSRPSPSTDVLAALTARELEAVALAAQGLSNGEITKRLFISPLTARTHIHRAIVKAGCATGPSSSSSPNPRARS